MSEEEEWIKTLKVPGATLPALRDYRVQFLALIVFDIMLGPIVYISEISTGSSYIKKLRTFSTLSEVYAGLARSPQHTVSTLEEDIAVFRYDQGSETDLTIVLLISCLPKSDLEPIREIGSKTLYKSKGDPEQIGVELSRTLREKLFVDKKVILADKKSSLFYWDDDRIENPLEGSTIKGLVIIDYEGKNADFRNLSVYIDSREIKPKSFIEFLNNQYSSITHGAATSLLYQGIPFLATKSKDKDIIIAVQISKNEFSILNKISSWLVPYSQLIANEWKTASQFEIQSCLMFFDEINDRNTPNDYILKYATALLRCERIRPNLGKVNLKEFDPPDFIQSGIWENSRDLEGTKSIAQLAKSWNVSMIDLISYLEWAQVNELIVYLQN